MAPLSLPHRHTLAAFLCAPLLAAAIATRYIGAAPTLIDHSIASGAAPMYLDGSEWTVTNTGGLFTGTLPATVPGDILTDLQRAKRIPDPYYNSSWRDAAFIAAWNEGTWR